MALVDKTLWTRNCHKYSKWIQKILKKWTKNCTNFYLIGLFSQNPLKPMQKKCHQNRSKKNVAPILMIFFVYDSDEFKKKNLEKLNVKKESSKHF